MCNLISSLLHDEMPPPRLPTLWVIRTQGSIRRDSIRYFKNERHLRQSYSLLLRKFNKNILNRGRYF